jgi:hypothetical protein
MAKATLAQLQELGLRIRRGQVPGWKIPAVFGIVEDDPLGKYLRLVEEARKEIISAEQVQALIEGKDQALGIFKVTVDYGFTLKQMIKAGKYDCDWVNRDITSERFPISGEGKVERELVLVHLGKAASTDEALVGLNRRGLRPAKIEELLALGAARPKFQKEFLIAALGSYWVSEGGSRVFTYIDGDVQYLGWQWDVYNWLETCRFLAVRKDAA